MMKTKTYIKEIEKHMRVIDKERDALDEAISKMTELKDSCERAWESLQDARDALSELV